MPGPWARWLAGRYRDAPNIVWSMTPEAKPEFVPILRELAAGLREGDGGRHLITFKPDPAPYSSSFIHAEKWLDFDSMQTWNRVELDLSVRHQGLQPEARQARPHGRRGLRGGLGIWISGHSLVGSPAGVLLLPGRRPSHLRAQRQLAHPSHLEEGPRRARGGANGDSQEDLPGSQGVVVAGPRPIGSCLGRADRRQGAAPGCPAPRTAGGSWSIWATRPLSPST